MRCSAQPLLASKAAHDLTTPNRSYSVLSCKWSSKHQIHKKQLPSHINIWEQMRRNFQHQSNVLRGRVVSSASNLKDAALSHHASAKNAHRRFLVAILSYCLGAFIVQQWFLLPLVPASKQDFGHKQTITGWTRCKNNNYLASQSGFLDRFSVYLTMRTLFVFWTTIPLS